MDGVKPEPPRPLMDAETFLAWTASQDDDARHELIDGEVIPVHGENDTHGVAKTEVAYQIRDQIGRGGVCRLFIGRKDVRAGERSIFQPDLVVDCTGTAREDGALTRPSFVVEITSPSTSRTDIVRKAPLYLQIPSLVALRIVDLQERRGLLYRRADAGPHGLEILAPDAEARVDLPTGLALRVDLGLVFSEAEARG